uniref:Uncharacterized protein n=1 Tax=Panagrolaimus superbus TaxID=310955 RepID=A0A914YNU5_9BILA
MILTDEFQENASNNVQQLLNNHDKSFNEMLSDDIGIQQGNDVKLLKPGSINLTLTFNKLEFEVCKHDCIGESKICYESLNGLGDTNAVGSCFTFPSSCEFKVKNGKDNDQIYFGDSLLLDVSGCLLSKMEYKYAAVLYGKFSAPIKSCDPKINPIDKMIKLQVMHFSLCPIIVKNAKIHVPEIASTISPPTANSNDPSLTASFPWWAILIIVLVIVFVVVAIVFVV